MKHLGCLLFLSPLFITACQEIDKNGELHATFKGHDVCLYIDDDNFKGDYEMSIRTVRKDNSRFWTYENNYETHYPSHDNCVIVNNANFSDWEGLKYDTYYAISLWSKHKDFDGVHRGRFCVIKENHAMKLVEPKDGACPKT